MSAKTGTCAACKQPMIQTEDDCWHPWNVERACPPEIDVNGISIPAWGSTGRPGRDFFVEDGKGETWIQPELF